MLGPLAALRETTPLAQFVALGKWGLLALLFAPRYPVRALDGASFTESIRTEAITRISNSSRRRLVAREAHFSSTLHGDTLVVSADSVTLSELADGHSRTLDTDGFVGGLYRLLVDSIGRSTLIERPFVPDDIVEVSDLSRAMDDFLPPLPPELAIDGSIDAGGRTWHRTADSSGMRRFRWSLRLSQDRTEAVGDSVPATIAGESRESGAMAWSPTRGPLAWTRRIESDITTRLRGQTIMASVVQRIDVRRTR
ncbi:MAG: hypothetical protein V4558_08085 [Gemmatimonadota bacterium]